MKNKYIKKSIFITIFVNFSCTTLQNKNISTEIIPAFLHEHFSACSPLEGGVNFQLNRGTEFPAIKGELDWRSQSRTLWEMQLLDSMGRSYLDLKLNQTSLSTSGEASGFLPSIAVKSDGALTANGAFIGFFATEIPCLLGFKLPHSWLQSLTSFDNNNFPRFIFSDNYRKIETTIKSKDKFKNYEICSTISWHGLFGLNPQTVNWCMRADDKQLNAYMNHAGTNIQVVWNSPR